jgi:hypothetical protein
MVEFVGMIRDDDNTSICDICKRIEAKKGILAHRSFSKPILGDSPGQKEKLIHTVHVRCFEERAKKQIERGEPVSCSECDASILNSPAFSVTSIEKQVQCFMVQRRIAARAVVLLTTTLVTTGVILTGKVAAEKIEMAKGALGKIAVIFAWSVRGLAMPLSLSSGVLGGFGMTHWIGKIRPTLCLNKENQEKRIQLLMEAATILMWINSITAHMLREDSTVLVGAAIVQATFGTIAGEFMSDLFY